MNLKDLGWNNKFQQQLTDEDKHLKPARVVRQDASGYTLINELGEFTGTLPKRSLKQIISKAQFPAVGDWVLVQHTDEDRAQGDASILRLLDRQSKLSRKEPGDKVDEQIIAANIDTVILVSGMDGELNLRRIERYLVLAWGSGASPVIVLNKCELVKNFAKEEAQIRAIAMSTPIHFISALTGEGMDQLKTYLSEGTTLAFIGSSGVGKSTIINELLGYNKFVTGEVRSDDNKGRHTTTFREMSIAPGGGLIIDTPGMREIQLWGDEDLLSSTFKDIESLANQCKFVDCKHQTEPHCAIRTAIENDELDESRLKSFRKLQAEIRFLAEQTNRKKQFEKKTLVKKHTRSNRRKRLDENLDYDLDNDVDKDQDSGD